MKRLFFCLPILCCCVTVPLLPAQEKPELKLGPKAEPPAMGSDYQPLLWRGADAAFALDTMGSGKCQLDTSGLVASKSSNTDLQEVAARSIDLQQRHMKRIKSMAKVIDFKFPSKKHQVGCAAAGDLAELNGTKFEQAYLDYLSKDNAVDSARFQAEAESRPNSANFELRKFTLAELPSLVDQQNSINALKTKLAPAKK